MAKFIRRYVTAKMVQKLVRKNPYAVGMSAAALALAGVALSLSRNPRVRALKDDAVRRLSPRTMANARLATAADPY